MVLSHRLPQSLSPSPANTQQVATTFEIGRRIVEYEQQGSKRAEYGERIVRELSHRLTKELGRGFSKRNLEYIRRFYLEYRNVTPQIAQTLSAQLPAKTPTETPIGQTPGEKVFRSVFIALAGLLPAEVADPALAGKIVSIRAGI